ncbi:MAG: RcnB family protein [Steroidobacteraceae bacterium]
MAAPRAEVDAGDENQPSHWKRGSEPERRESGNVPGNGPDRSDRSEPREPREPQAHDRPAGQPGQPVRPREPREPVQPVQPAQPVRPSIGPPVERPRWRGNQRPVDDPRLVPDRGDRNDARDPRPDMNRDHDQRTWNRDQRAWDRDGHDRNWNRDRSWDRNYWRDDRGRQWPHERNWYDRYRFDHFHFYGGRYVARQRFFLGYYYLPFAYVPRVWVIGDWLPAAFFYDGRYFVDDYWRFDLYDPPYRCRWLRVRGDALLVDIGTGEVLDVVYDLYW